MNSVVNGTFSYYSRPDCGEIPRRGNATDLTIKNSSTQLVNWEKMPVQFPVFLSSSSRQHLRVEENKVFSLDADGIVQKFVFHELFQI